VTYLPARHPVVRLDGGFDRPWWGIAATAVSRGVSMGRSGQRTRRGHADYDAHPGLHRNAWSELPRIVSRAGKVDRVELKIQLAPDGLTEAGVAEVLGLRAVAERSREVYYLDSSDLALHRKGFVTRARLSSPGRADLVCKLRRRRARRLPGRVRRLPRLSIELDALPDQTIWCVSVKHTVDASALRDAIRRRQTWAELCSPEQMLFLRSLADGPMRIDDFILFGPVSVRKLTGRVPGLGCLAVECWSYPDGRRLLELSTKCSPGRVHRTAADIRGLLAAGAVPLSPTQGTKTDTTLRHLGAAE
jgi:hypothetical protein